MVDREEHARFSCTSGAAQPLCVRREANGRWFVEMSVDVTITLPDGREVSVKREIAVLASGYVGFKRRRPTRAREVA